MLSQFYQELKAEFPSMQEQPPLFNVIEPEFLTPQFQPLRLQLDRDVRIFMTSEDKTYVVQFQRDRFVLNWRRVRPDAQYPRFASNFPKFEALLAKFETFVKKHELGEVTPNQFELTYVNIIDSKNGLDEYTMNGLFVDHFRNVKDTNRFLPLPEGLNWQSSYALPARAGRLHVNALTSHILDDLPRGQVLRVDLTARGIGEDRSVAGRSNWFDLAHRWIVLGFSDIVRSNVQDECWGRQ